MQIFTYNLKKLKDFVKLKYNIFSCSKLALYLKLIGVLIINTPTEYL